MYKKGSRELKGSRDYAGWIILDKLELIDGLVRGTKKKWIATIITGGDKAVDQYSSGVSGETGMETINVVKVEISRMTPRLLT